MYEPHPTWVLQRQEQARHALARVLALARLLAAAPQGDVPAALGTGLDALREALAAYDVWTPPGSGQ